MERPPLRALRQSEKVLGRPPAKGVLPCPLKLLGLPLLTPLPTTSSHMWQTSGSRVAKQGFVLKRSLEVKQSYTSPSSFPQPLKWSHLLCPQSLLLSAPFVPSFLKAASHKGLLQTRSPSTPPKSRFHQGNAKAISAQCFTEQPWLRPPSLLQRMEPFARLHKPVFNASKLFQ